MSTPAGWIRERGRDDYDGWVLYIGGDIAQMIVGHPLWKCIFYQALHRLGLISSLPICGKIRFLEVMRRGAALKLAEAVK